MSHKKLRPFIVKVSVLGYFPLQYFFTFLSGIVVELYIADYANCISLPGVLMLHYVLNIVHQNRLVSLQRLTSRRSKLVM